MNWTSFAAVINYGRVLLLSHDNEKFKISFKNQKKLNIKNLNNKHVFIRNTLSKNCLSYHY